MNRKFFIILSCGLLTSLSRAASINFSLASGSGPLPSDVAYTDKSNDWSAAQTSQSSWTFSGGLLVPGELFFDSVNNNLFIGDGAGQGASGASYNTAIGESSMPNFLSSNRNTALGYSSGHNFFGSGDAENVFIGYKSAFAQSSGQQNVYIGGEAALVANNGDDNTYVGYNAGSGQLGGSNNIYLGANTNADSHGSSQLNIGNTILGSLGTNVGILGTPNAASYKFEVPDLLRSDQPGQRGNAAFGPGAGGDYTATNYNLALGENALQAANGNGYNTAVGYGALQNATDSDSNVAVGQSALHSLTTGATGNTGVGTSALYSMDFYGVGGGDFAKNTAVGEGALQNQTTGQNNVGIGYVVGGSGMGDVTGDNNVLIGGQAATTLQSGDNNIIIGAHAEPANGNGSNQLNIGGVLYGDMAVQWIGIGLSTGSVPGTPGLDVSGDVRITGTYFGEGNGLTGVQKPLTIRGLFVKASGPADLNVNSSEGLATVSGTMVYVAADFVALSPANVGKRKLAIYQVNAGGATSIKYGAEVNNATSGTSTSDIGPDTVTLGGTLDINIDSDGAQTITTSANLSGAAIAADIQAKVRALTANTPSNQSAIDNFTAAFTGGLYVLTSGSIGAGSSVVVTDGAGSEAADLKLGVANGGTEVSGVAAQTPGYPSPDANNILLAQLFTTSSPITEATTAVTNGDINNDVSGR